jgi:hypothetical protein
MKKFLSFYTKRKVKAIIVLMLIMVVLWPVQGIGIYCGGSLLRFVNGVDDGFAITYVHSLYRVPQQEVYRVSKGLLIIETMRFGSIEARNYYDWASPAVFRDGWWEQPSGKVFREVVVRVPYYSEPFLLTRKVNLALTEIARPGSRLVIKPQKRCLLFLISERGISWIRSDV